MARKTRSVLALALSVTLALGTIPAPALAEIADGALQAEAPQASVPQPAASQDGALQTEDSHPVANALGAQASTPSLVEVPPVTMRVEPIQSNQSNEELFAAYAQKKFDEPLEQPDAGVQLETQSAAARLTGRDAKAFSELKKMVTSVADGELDSTVFTIPLSKLTDDLGPWSASELGVTELIVDRHISQEAKNAILDKVAINLSAVTSALLADCPYELYWCDKTQGIGYRPFESYSITYEVDGPRVSCVGDTTVVFRVASEYLAAGTVGTTQVNTDLTKAVTSAVTEAQNIVTRNQGAASNLERLRAYKNEICNAVTYNEEAAKDEGMPYGNPWQLVWVFDKDPDTNVVCEGYSKAFKYLCDLTWKSPNDDIECLLASDIMSVGDGGGFAHMWNVVRMDDGRNYLADLTNCDDDTVGAPEQLFIAKKYAGSYETAYGFSVTVDTETKTVYYQYDDETRGNFGEEALTISGNSYQGPVAASPIAVPSAAQNLIYSGEEQVGVAAGEGYTLQGNTATNAGNYAATATPNFGYEWTDGTRDAKEIPWSIARKPVTVTADDKSKAYGEADPALTATVVGLVGEDTVSYTLSRAGGDGAGEYAITPTGEAEQGNYAVTYVSGKLTISPADISAAEVAPVADQTFSGSELKPAVSVMLDGHELVAGTDYDVSYASNVNAGTATATITGKGNYTGTKAVEFRIAPKPVDVPAAATGLVYDGNERTGVPAGEGYALTGDVVRREAGTYTATATLDANYVWTGGSAEPVNVGWSIARKPVTVTADDKSKEYGEPDPALTATVEGTVGEDTVSYTLSRAGGDDAGEYAITPAGDAVQGNYAVAYVSGKLTIVSGNDVIMAEIASISDKTFTGSAIEPPVTVTLRGRELAPGTDYDVTYASNVNAGTATATITGKGSYTGTKAVEFRIARKPVTVTADDKSKAYGEADPALTATVVGLVGEDTVSYTLSRAEGDDAGEYAITPTGEAEQGNYAVTYAPGKLTITKAPSKMTASVVRPQVTVTYDALKDQAVRSSNITARGAWRHETYANVSSDATARKFWVGFGTGFLTVPRGTMPGTYRLDVRVADEADGNHVGKAVTLSYDVAVRCPVSALAVTAPQAQTYTGGALTPRPGVRLGSTALREGVDYTLSYRDNVSVGTATVTITGRGSYTGTRNVNFAISAPAKTFPDVAASAWYAGVVSRAVGLGLMSGYKDGRFGPADKVTRGQVAVILWNMAGKPAVGAGAKTFPDVGAKDYFYNAVRWASSRGVVSGYGNGKFGPNDDVTREQLAVMLANYARGVAGRQVSGSAADYAKMRDGAKVSSWAQASVGWCFRNQIISGTKDGNVNPKGNAARAEAAKMVVVLHDMLG